MVFTRIAPKLVVVLLLSGCAAHLVGSESDRTGIQPDGTYVLTEQEKTMDCTRLTDQTMWHIREMKKLVAKEKRKREAPPRSIVSAIARTVGASRSGNTNARIFEREYATVIAMNTALAEKGCTTVDVKARVGDGMQLMRGSEKRQSDAR